MSHIAQQILSLRKAAGLSQEGLAEQLGVSRQAVSKWESGTAVPSIENLVELSRVLGAPVGELLELEQPPAAAPGDSLTAAELRALLSEYSAQAAAPRTWSRPARLLALCAGTLALVLIAAQFLWMQSRVDELQRRLSLLDGRMDGVAQSVDAQIGYFTASLEERLEARESLVAHYDCRETDYDPQRSLITLELSAVPKEYEEGTTATFVLTTAGGEARSAEGEAGPGNTFSARITLPIDDGEHRLSVSFQPPEGPARTQLLETLYGLGGDYRLTLNAWLEDDAPPASPRKKPTAAVEITPAYQQRAGQEGRLSCWPVEASVTLVGQNGALRTWPVDVSDYFDQEGLAPQDGPALYGAICFYIPLEGEWDAPDDPESLSLVISVTDNFGAVQTQTIPWTFL